MADKLGERVSEFEGECVKQKHFTKESQLAKNSSSKTDITL